MSPTEIRGGIVFLHGHGRRGASLGRMARAARDRGYATINPPYRYRRALPDIVADLGPQIRAFADKIGTAPHFVTHSLGGIVVRAMLARGGVEAANVVMLGPPNAGSEWADLLTRLRIDGIVLGPIAGHLRTGRTVQDEALLAARVDRLGIIAGDRAIDPVFPRIVVPRPNDGKVAVAATKLDGADHLVLPVTHTLMVYDKRVIRQTLAFVEHGRFER